MVRRPSIVVPTLLGIVMLVVGRTPQGALLLAVAAGQVLALSFAPRTAAVVGGHLGRAGRAVLLGVAAVLWLPIAIAFAIAWALSPLLRTDPLQRRSAGAWHPVAAAGGTVADATASWTRRRQTPSPAERRARRVRRVLVLGSVGALLLVVLDGRAPWSATSVPSGQGADVGTGAALVPIEPPFALRDQPGADQVRQAEGAVFSQMEADPVVGWRLPADFRSDVLNVVGHRRASVQASDAGPVVWFFGGSTMFGSNQRDDRTIASRFAASAAADGHPVRVVNFGVHAYTAYQEAELLQSLLETEPPPDAVIFYDGYNDVAVSVGLSFLGRPPGVPHRAPSLAGGATPEAPAASTPPPWWTPEERYDGVAEVQAQAIALADRALRGTGVPVFHFWQPNAFTRAPTAEESEQLTSLGIDLAARETYQAIHEGVRARLPEDTIDLGDALDDAPTVYVDQVHTNELGAQLVANAMYEAIRPQIRKISP